MPRPKNEELWKLYKYCEINKAYICKNGGCNKVLRGHAGNLERHLKVFHPESYVAYIGKKCGTSLNKSKSKKEIVKVSCTAYKENIQKAIVELFTKNGRPLRMAADCAFKILTKPVCDAANIKLNKRYVIRKIAEFSSNLKKEIGKELSGKFVSLIIDSAKSSSVSVFVVNVQYVSNNNKSIKTIALKELKQRLTSDYLKSVLMEVLEEYNINLHQILTITTGNGENMIEAVNDLKHTIIKTEVDSDNDIDNKVMCVDKSLSLDSITNVICASHTLQLCVMDVLKREAIKKRLEYIRMVVMKLKSQTYVNRLRNGCHKLPILDSPTRWNSTYLMLERLTELKEFINLIKADNPFFNISDECWAFIDEFLSVFQITYTASKKLQSENLIYSDFYIEIMNIVLRLENLPTTELRTSLIDAVKKRKSLLFENDLFVTAIFLDPRVKVSLTLEQIAKAKNCIKELNTRLSFLEENNTTLSSSPANESSNSLLHSASALNATENPFEAFLNKIDKPSFDENTIHNIGHDLILYERQRRLTFDENIFEFWNIQQNCLSKIAFIVLSIPYTQVSVERFFSGVKNILTEQQNKRVTKTVENILLVRANGVFNYIS